VVLGAIEAPEVEVRRPATSASSAASQVTGK